MSRRTSVWLAACAHMCLVASVSAMTVPLSYVKLTPEQSPRSDTGLGCYRRLKAVPARPSGAWKLPNFNAPLYALVDLGATAPRLLVLDRVEGSAYTRLYFDENGDRVMREEPIDGKVSGTTTVFAPIETRVRVGSKTLSYMFRVEVEDLRRQYNSLSPEHVYVYIVATCCYTGTAEIGGRTQRIFLADANVNGVFGEKPPRTRAMITSTEQLNADRLHMTEEDQKTAEDAGWIMGDFLVIEDSAYRVQVAPDHSRLVLSPYTSQTGPVDFPEGLDRLSLCDERGQTWVMVARPSEKTRVPMGKWRIVACDSIRKDAQGNVWSMHARPQPKDAMLYVGRKGNEVVIGEPLVPTVDARKSGLHGLVMSFRLLGAGKEEVMVTYVNPQGTRYRPAAPTFRILSEQGQVVHQGSFRYG